MFKIFKILLFLVTLSLANNDFYNKALEYEKNGDILNAMRYYKMAFEFENNSKVTTIKNEKNQDEGYLERVLGLKTHELNYLMPFTYATNAFDERSKFETKFAFSVKKPLFYDIFGLKESFNLAYSQTSWWQTSRNSMPFRESNYRPEFFINFDLNSFVDEARIGFLHESNGRDGAKSRSWNRIYAQATFKVGNITLTPRIWVPVGSLNDNENITKYIGYADILARYDYKKHIISALLRDNLHLNNTNHGAIEIRWLFPTFSDGFYGYVSYFNGYGESLIDYNKHTNKIGLGFAVLR